MFKAIVVEIKDKYAIVMLEGGEFIRIKLKNGLNVGEKIFCFEEDIYKSDAGIERNKLLDRKLLWIMPLCAAAMLMIIFLNPIINMFSTNSNSIYAILTFDVNPSIEFELDENGMILHVKAINDDGSKLNINEIQGMNLETGILKLKEILYSNNYIGNGNSVLVGFSFIDKESSSYEEKIQNIMQDAFKDTSVAFLKGDEQSVEIAKSNGMSLGKYEALLQLDEDGVEDAIENLSTQKLLELLEELHKDKLFLNKEALEELHDEFEDRVDEEEEQDEEDEYEYEEDDFQEDKDNGD